MKERPILFKGEMVRAIMEGKKTQTRRVVKSNANGEIKTLKPTFAPHVFEEDTGDKIVCPHGQAGDRLWVRETFMPIPLEEEGYYYRADLGEQGEKDEKAILKQHGPAEHPWKPSIFMPRKACRLVLKVASIHVQRLNDISRGDAMAEGCPFPNMQDGPDPREWFSDLWKSINGAESWEDNPWVWVIEFKKV